MHIMIRPAYSIVTRQLYIWNRMDTKHSFWYVTESQVSTVYSRGLHYSFYPGESTFFNMAVTGGDINPKVRDMPIYIFNEAAASWVCQVLDTMSKIKSHVFEWVPSVAETSLIQFQVLFKPCTLGLSAVLILWLDNISKPPTTMLS